MAKYADGKGAKFMRVWATAIPESYILTPQTKDLERLWLSEFTHDNLMQQNWVGVPVRWEHKVDVAGAVVAQLRVPGKGVRVLIELPLRPKSWSNKDTATALKNLGLSMMIHGGKLTGVSLHHVTPNITNDSVNHYVRAEKHAVEMTLTSNPDRVSSDIISVELADEPYRHDGQDVAPYDASANGSVTYMKITPRDSRGDKKKSIEEYSRTEGDKEKEKEKNAPAENNLQEKTNGKTAKTMTDKTDKTGEAAWREMAEAQQREIADLKRKASELEESNKKKDEIVDRYNKRVKADNDQRNEAIYGAFEQMHKDTLADIEAVLDDKSTADEATKARARIMKDDIKKAQAGLKEPLIEALNCGDEKIIKTFDNLTKTAYVRSQLGSFRVEAAQAAAAGAAQAKASAEFGAGAQFDISLSTPQDYAKDVGLRAQKAAYEARAAAALRSIEE